MDAVVKSPSTSPGSSSSSSNKRRQQMSAMSRTKKKCLSFMTSLQECFAYFKASLVGQTKKMTAKSEKEAAEADLMASKMQFEAVDAAEDAKKQLYKSN